MTTSDYRRGAILGLTVAEVFILLSFLLLIALLGFIQADEPISESDSSNAPLVWVRPEEIETLVDSAEQAREAQEQAEQALADVEQERDAARAQAEQAREVQEQAEQALADAEQRRDAAQAQAEQARKAHDGLEQTLAAVERDREQAQENLEVLRRKGENPPCWYRVVSAGEGKTREKPHYAFNVAIYEDSIELSPRTAPPGGARDDGGGLYADEWKRLNLEALPHGVPLSDNEFTAAVSDLVAKGRSQQVRTYECVFSVMVWDKTPDFAKKRWKYAHDRVIEGSFSAYTVQDLEWRGVD